MMLQAGPLMRSRIPTVVLPPEIGDFAEEIRRIFAELGRAPTSELGAGECSPPVDIYETDDAVEIRVDLPGVEATAARVLIKGDGVLIAGQKAARRSRGDSTFHLVERGFGRFARVVRLSAPCDSRRARAVLTIGELRITVPKIPERRGRAIPVAIQTEGGKPS
jgi:HSP20 family protein